MNEDYFFEFQQLLDSSKRILLCTHRNPDGDGIGTMMGLADILQASGKDVTILLEDALPASLQFLPCTATTVRTLQVSDVYDLSCVIDTSSDALMNGAFLTHPCKGAVAFIDHHLDQHSDLPGLLIRYPSSATGEIVFDMARVLCWPLSRNAALCLYTAIASDTSLFKYSGTTPATHRAAAALIDKGATPSLVARNLFEKHPIRSARIFATVISTIDMDAACGFSWVCCNEEVRSALNIDMNDLHGVVNAARAVVGVEVAGLFAQENDGVHVQLRARGRANLEEIFPGKTRGKRKTGAQWFIPDISISQAVAGVRAALRAAFPYKTVD